MFSKHRFWKKMYIPRLLFFTVCSCAVSCITYSRYVMCSRNLEWIKTFIERNVLWLKAKWCEWIKRATLRPRWIEILFRLCKILCSVVNQNRYSRKIKSIVKSKMQRVSKKTTIYLKWIRNLHKRVTNIILQYCRTYIERGKGSKAKGCGWIKKLIIFILP